MAEETSRHKALAKSIADLVQIMTLQTQQQNRRAEADERRAEAQERRAEADQERISQLAEENDRRAEAERERNQRQMEESERRAAADRELNRERADELKLQQLTILKSLEEHQALQLRKLQDTHDIRMRTGKDLPTLSSLKDPKQIEPFLAQYQAEMVKYKVPREQWSTILKPLLDDKSQTFVTTLPRETQEDFDQLSEKLLILNGVTKDYYRQQYEIFSAPPDEDPLQTGIRAQSIVDAWTKKCTTAQEVRDHFATEKLLSSLEEDVATWTRNQLPIDPRPASSIASTYKASRPKKPLPTRGFRSTTSYAPRSVKMEKKPEWDKEKGPLCFACGTYGHIAKQCPTKETEKAVEKTVNVGIVPPTSSPTMEVHSTDAR